MDNSIDLQSTLDFLTHLQANNDRNWFEQNRATYQEAKDQFEHLINLVIHELQAIEDLGDLSAKDCVMRIYRDVRFSKDKSPYRTHFAAAISKGGRRASRMPYYLSIAPQNESFIAGGLYSPTTEQLSRFRETIDQNAKPFKAVLNSRSFKPLFKDLSGEKLKTAPQGYSRDHPEIELLKFKQVTATFPLSDEAVLATTFPAQILETFIGLKPLLDYLNSVLLV